MRSPLPTITIDPDKATKIAQEVYNALGAPKHLSDLEKPRIEHDLKSHFARFAPLYDIQRSLPAFRNGHWGTLYRAYLEQVRLLVAAYVTERNGERFLKSEKVFILGDAIPSDPQIPLFPENTPASPLPKDGIY